MPPAALRGRLRGGRQGAAPPGPPICTAWQTSYTKLTLKLFFYKFRKMYNLSGLLNVDMQSKPCGSGVQGEPPPCARRVGAAGGILTKLAK